MATTSLDILTKAHMAKQARDTEIGEPVERFTRSVQNMQSLKLQAEKQKMDQILNESKIQKAQLEISNQEMQSRLLNEFLNGNDPTTSTSSSSGGGPLLTQFKVGNATFTNPQAKAREQSIIANAKPLSGETARMFSGAKQGLQNIKEIRDIFNLKTDEDGNVVAQDFNIKQSALQRERVLQNTGVGKPGSLVQIMSLGFADDVAKKMGVSTEVGRKLALQFSTLAENNLRARTGAQAPEPEKVAEELRTILNGLDNPTTLLDKLQESENFLRETASQIRPLRELPNTGLKEKVRNFQSPEEADSSGLPKGTIVLVNKRRYQI